MLQIVTESYGLRICGMCAKEFSGMMNIYNEIQHQSSIMTPPHRRFCNLNWDFS